MPLLEYKPEPENMFSGRSATAPSYVKSKTGHEIEREI
jgi:hypothetical protein